MNRLFIIAVFIGLQGCFEARVSSDDPGFNIKNGLLFYRQKPFTGVQLSKVTPLGVRRESHYVNGLKDGPEQAWYKNGNLAEKRLYKKGKKVGTHSTWHMNGRYRMYIEFQDGVQHGDYWGWHDNGQVATYALYENGNKIGHKAWRRNGQIYFNYVFKDKVMRGFRGAKSCNPLKKQVLAKNL